MADAPLRDLIAGGINDADLMSGEGAAACHKAQGGGIIFVGRKRLAGPCEGLAPNAIDLQTTARRGKCHAQRGLGQTVDRRHGFRPKAILAEAFAEPRHRVGAYGLSAIQRHLPGAEVQPFDIAVIDAAQTQLVGEVRRRGNRASVIMDGPQPASRPARKASGDISTSGQAKYSCPNRPRSAPCHGTAAASSRTRRRP